MGMKGEDCMSYRIEEGPISMEFLNVKSFWHLWIGALDYGIEYGVHI
jgi:hypothetical protein